MNNGLFSKLLKNRLFLWILGVIILGLILVVALPLLNLLPARDGLLQQLGRPASDVAVDASQDTALPSDNANLTLASAIGNASSAEPFPVRQGFASVSIETFHVCNFVYQSHLSTMANIDKDLGTGGVIRVGGVSVNSTGWDGQSTRDCPNDAYEDTATITPPMIQHLLNFAHSIGWKVIWSVGYQLTPAQAADEAATAQRLSQQIASGADTPLLAIEIGNEPELDLPKATNYQQFTSTWLGEANAVKARASSVNISGPDVCCAGTQNQWYAQFLQSDSSHVQIATAHIYPADGNQNPSIQDILSPKLRQETLSSIDQLRQQANDQHLPLLISETNSMANTPAAVGTTFGQSLWAADYLFAAQEHGAIGLNFHGGAAGDATSPTQGNAGLLTVQATYYGMLFFHQATAAGGHVVAVRASAVSTDFNVGAHAIRGSDGKLYVALINMGAQDRTLTVDSGRATQQQVHVLRMTAPSVQAQNGITVAGSGINADGSWTGKQLETAPITSSTNIATVKVPAYSAALVIFSPAS